MPAPPRRPVQRIVPCGLALALLLVAAVGASVTTARAAEESPDVTELRAAVKRLEKTVERLQARVKALEKEKGSAGTAAAPAAAAPAEAPPAPPSPAPPASAPPTPAPEASPAPAQPTAAPSGKTLVPDYNTVSDEQPAAPRVDNAPLDPDQKGFIQIPGTKSRFRIGGSARIDAIENFENNGNPNLFVPSGIPVPGQPDSEGGPEFGLEAKATRITFELRRPAEKSGSLRVYYENDFFGDSASPGMDYRLRHFYGQAWNVLVGQTFSAFQNIDSWPDTVDYQGPNAMINRRQPQIRYSLPLYESDPESHTLIFSGEQPISEVDTSTAGFPPGSSPATPLPDAVVGYRWESGWGHLQASGLAREIATESDDGSKLSVFGWGVNLSGALNVLDGDKLSYQVAWGQGMARYVNDLSGLDMDAALRDDGTLKAIPVFAPMVGYLHQWSKSWRSTATFGYVDVDPVASEGPFAVKNTTYASINLIWQPKPSFRMGLEYLYGDKETQNGAARDGSRLDLVLKYDLVR